MYSPYRCYILITMTTVQEIVDLADAMQLRAEERKDFIAEEMVKLRNLQTEERAARLQVEKREREATLLAEERAARLQTEERESEARFQAEQRENENERQGR